MQALIRRQALAWLVASGCASGASTVTQHEHLARRYEATADSIEVECAKARRDELTVDTPSPCWKSQDVRFLEANRGAATKHRAAAVRLRTLSAQR